MRKHKRCSCRSGGQCCCGGCGGNSFMLIVTIGVTVGFLMAYAVRKLIEEEII